ncbi:hypothetical protein RxyAA322_07160 [Rubrobacter xylanophilus]|uniref:Phosphatidate cytidylyltransferase n=1 Tax=Rubrobacter xylanophilus TaxID=49319 RepID=A0A510HFX7_9ACTN|nr:phosphatidate cytidylyltransferase [Rubrobacter xylanophilus]BBL78862.1 hypothetical protein RxyAA322_07160 [Rubrobacter xylanophilus]
MLARRVATAAVLAPLVLAAIAVGGAAVYAVLLLVGVAAAYELSRALAFPFAAALVAVLAPPALALFFGAGGVLGGLLLGVPWALAWLVALPRLRDERALLGLLLASVWVGAPLGFLALILGLEHGRAMLLLAVVGSWVSDAGAYFCGLAAGRHRIFPVLSPAKTLEGSLGGLLATALCGGVAGSFLPDLSPSLGLLLGATVSLASQAGDLFESALKRILGVKDLGSLLPGHGGILDRIDSLLFVAPTVYYLLLLA